MAIALHACDAPIVDHNQPNAHLFLGGDLSCCTALTAVYWMCRQKFSKATRRIAFQTFWR